MDDLSVWDTLKNVLAIASAGTYLYTWLKGVRLLKEKILSRISWESTRLNPSNTQRAISCFSHVLCGTIMFLAAVYLGGEAAISSIRTSVAEEGTQFVVPDGQTLTQGRVYVLVSLDVDDAAPAVKYADLKRQIWRPTRSTIVAVSSGLLVLVVIMVMMLGVLAYVSEPPPPRGSQPETNLT
jgi:hypothetical protein